MEDGLKQAGDQMELNDLDEDLLTELRDGARTQGYLTDSLGEPRHKIRERLRLLAAAGYIENIHETTALYELRNDPEDDNG